MPTSAPDEAKEEKEKRKGEEEPAQRLRLPLRAGEGLGARGEATAGDPGSLSPRSSGAGGGPSRGPGVWPVCAQAAWGSLPLAPRPSGGQKLKERRPPAGGSRGGPASRACGDG